MTTTITSADDTLRNISIWYNEAYNGISGQTLCAAEETKKINGQLNLTWLINGLFGSDHTSSALKNFHKRKEVTRKIKVSKARKAVMLAIFPLGPIVCMLGHGLRAANLVQGQY